MAYAGIDYGNGLTNIDHTTGIRYGVISQHSVGQAWYDDAEADYGEPTCPKCGNMGVVDGSTLTDEYEPVNPHTCADYACHLCKLTFESSEAYSDEPLGCSYDGEGYKLTDCLDSDIMVLASPYYTYAPFCSPCVPGACDLDSPLEPGLNMNNQRAYCLGHEWFESNVAPYRVFRVSDNSEVTV